VTSQIIASLPTIGAALAVGYLLGTIPFGLLVTRVAGTGDIRQIGSGNIGATNVLRTGRKSLAAATLVGDMLKGSAAVWLAAWLWGRQPALAAGLGAVLGHVFPLWLRFRGGKGVATYIGVLIALSWPVAAAFGGAWIAVAAVTRYSSLAGLVASALTPVLLWVIGARQEALLFAALTALVWIMHRANITRLLAGTEAKIGMKSAPPPPA
jgi:glycerol-3-phosphate acyltransferase PlsY